MARIRNEATVNTNGGEVELRRAGFGRVRKPRKTSRSAASSRPPWAAYGTACGTHASVCSCSVQPSSSSVSEADAQSGCGTVVRADDRLGLGAPDARFSQPRTARRRASRLLSY